MPGTKVLLLNASNLETHPVYPYAFVQVPAIARQVGIEVVCKDLLGIPSQSWGKTVGELIEQNKPAMILITLRNTDSLELQDYKLDGENAEAGEAYFPIERTRKLIAAIRDISDLKIALGGFGFSLLPGELMHDLRPDFGVWGDPDDFFAQFDEIQNGHLDQVVNLMFFREDRLVSNERVLYPPFGDAEYMPQTIAEMMAFYDAFPKPGFQGAAVEIMRGCNHSCVFCAEPHSKGNKVRYRDLAAIMQDIEILVDHGITCVYLVSSELNPEGNEFVLELADRIWSFNESQAEEGKITWYGANYLLKFNQDELERLYRSGFTGGWFDITALDDENAGAMRTPYRNAHLVTNLKAYAIAQKKQIEHIQAQKSSGAREKARAGDGREEKSVAWSMFLGNPATTLSTIRNTLRIADEEGLSSLFDRCGLSYITRVFDYEEPSEATLAVTFSVTPDLRRASYQQALPSFAYPPALLRDFSENDISEMFRYIGETYLSKQYQQTRDWHAFVTRRATPESLSRWIGELESLAETYLPPRVGQLERSAGSYSELFVERQAEAGSDLVENQLAKEVAGFLVSTCIAAFPAFFESLGMPGKVEVLDNITPYRLATALYRKWAHVDDLVSQCQIITPTWKGDLFKFCVLAIMYRFNVMIKAEYKRLFI